MASQGSNCLGLYYTLCIAGLWGSSPPFEASQLLNAPLL